MRDDLAVRQRAVHAGAHGAQVGLADLGVDRRAGEFAVRQDDPVTSGRQHHALEEVGPDLVAEAPGPAVNADHHITDLETVDLGDVGGVDGHHLLDLQVVIAGAEGSHFVFLSSLGLIGDLLRLGAYHTPALFDAVEVSPGTVAALDGPLRAAGQHRVHLFPVQVQTAGAPDAGRNMPEQHVSQAFFHRGNVVYRQTRAERPDPAGDVEPHAPGGQDAASVGIEGGDAADRKPVPPVRVGHGVGGPDDAR